MMKTPEVRIYFSWLLYERVSVPLNEHWNAEGKQEFASQEQCEEYAENYRGEWAKYADKILPALTEILGVSFYRNVIDVPCTPWIRAVSDPLTMNFRYFPDQFVDALMHELCHVLLTDNDVYSTHSSDQRVWLNERWAELFGKEHDFTTLVHIPVHALSKYVYLDVLKEPSRLERDKENVKDDPAYTAAWQYVETHDYQKINEQLRQDYAELSKELAA